MQVDTINSLQIYCQNVLIWKISCIDTVTIGVINGGLVILPSRLAIEGNSEHELQWESEYEDSCRGKYA